MREDPIGRAGEPYKEPVWTDHITVSTPNVPGQICASLTRSKQAGVPWPLAWRGVLRTIRWPHDHDSRHEWHALIDDEEWVAAVWKSAYLGRPCERGDMSMLHFALEDRTGHAPGKRQIGVRGAGRAA